MMRVTLYTISPAAYALAIDGKAELFAPNMDSATDLDAAWHAIHYLVTGNSELRFLLDGHDLAWAAESMEVHEPHNVARLHERLRDATIGDVIAGYDAEKFNRLGIYPRAWDAGGASYIAPYLDRFAAIIARAAADGDGLFVVTA